VVGLAIMASAPATGQAPEPCYAVKRFLCRQGHAEKSGRFARSTAQLLLSMVAVA
jgi:hypothetical protein